MIKAEGISKKIGDRQIIADINLQVAPHEITVVFGPSGCGKTTLLRNLSLLDYPDSGQLCIDDLIYSFPTKLKQAQLPYPKVTVVFQQLFLWPHLTNRQNITLALDRRSITYESQLTYLDYLTNHMQMRDYVDRYPNQSSLGQKQRIAIARALILKPSYLFFDEITAALDTVQTAHLIKLIREVKESDTGILFVTHDLVVARKIADKALFIEAGRIVEQGTVAIFSDPKTPELSSFLQTIE